MSVKWWKYKDTDTLNRVQYEDAIEIQDIMIKKKFTTKYMDQRFRFHILENIHRKALKYNYEIDRLSNLDINDISIFTVSRLNELKGISVTLPYLSECLNHYIFNNRKSRIEFLKERRKNNE